LTSQFTIYIYQTKFMIIHVIRVIHTQLLIVPFLLMFRVSYFKKQLLVLKFYKEVKIIIHRKMNEVPF